MNDVERWIYFDGPEPEHLRPLLDALRDLPPATPEDKERAARRFFETLDAALDLREDPPVEEDRRANDTPGAPAPEGEDPKTPAAGATVRSPRALSARILDESLERIDAIDPRACNPPVPQPPVARAPASLAGTAPALELPAVFREPRDALPFKPALPGAPRAARTLQVPVLRSGLGETAPLGDDSIAKAVAALPFAASTVGAGIVLFPRLKVEEYASLRAELAVWPERSAAVLLRYRVVNAAAHRALDEHWQTHLADHPEARTVFESALAQFTGWLRTLPA